MVLTEAFAAGTPVVASEIAGYRDVVDDGANGVLVPHGDPLALAEALRDLALEPARRALLNDGAAASAAQYSWPLISEQTTQIYEQAIAAGATGGKLLGAGGSGYLACYVPAASHDRFLSTLPRHLDFKISSQGAGIIHES